MTDPASSSPLPLRERNKQRARRRLLAAARALLDEHGYRRATMRQIAEQAGVSHQTLYNYFPTKAQLLQELLLEDVGGLVGQVDAAIARYGDETSNLHDTLMAIHRLRFQVAEAGDRELWRVVSLDLLERQPGTVDLIALIDRGALTRLARLLALARQRGELRADVDTATLAEIVFAVGQHAASRFLLDPDSEADGLLAMLDRQTRLLLTALAR